MWLNALTIECVSFIGITVNDKQTKGLSKIEAFEWAQEEDNCFSYELYEELTGADKAEIN